MLVFLACSVAAADQTVVSGKQENEKQTAPCKSLSCKAADQKLERPQEYVEVTAKDNPGLSLSVGTPVESLEDYVPPPEGEFTTAADVIMRYRPIDWDTGTGARPHKSGKLVSVPVVKE